MVKLLSLAALKGLVLALGAAKFTQAGFLDDDCGFINDGPQFTLRGDGSITTYCNDKICSTVTFTVINLNDCITNVFGDLQPKAEGQYGNFWKSCKDCHIEGTYIKCQCSKHDGSYKESSLNVSKYNAAASFSARPLTNHATQDGIVFNWNGYLACHSQVSNCYPMPWRCKPRDWWPEGWRPNVVDTPCDIWQAAMMTPAKLTLPPGLTLSTDLMSGRRA
ncbi:CVNH domain-containing protein [Colletotrichum tofieldiae]|nr:CVNH domain-containing protein [Colletotrichum tofieldiae]GKT69099.1 CVNH domain-containing protein [Colletotrichum tofieldiae]GKT96610.1 CVNH domain-containing protein [Colletotrichum tofieldiae]